jgi:hypothetical protein
MEKVLLASILIGSCLMILNGLLINYSDGILDRLYSRI